MFTGIPNDYNKAKGKQFLSVEKFRCGMLKRTLDSQRKCYANKNRTNICNRAYFLRMDCKVSFQRMRPKIKRS